MGVIKMYTGINVIMKPICIIKTKERKYTALLFLNTQNILLASGLSKL